MAIPSPSDDELSAIADRYGLGLGPEEIGQYRDLIAGALLSYDTVERLYAGRVPEPPSRAWKRPAEEDNELGAWYVTTGIRGSGEGPLAGRRVAVKDNIAVAGVPMMNGSATMEGFVPRRDATVVTRLLEAGAVIAGKAVCEDLCLDGGSHTARTGPVLNPWDRSKSTGGSSSGSAALVASGAVDLAVGGDQAGSVRIPASFCGVVGHKPTHGLVPYTGAFPIENTIDHLGPITRTVRDAALMLSVLAGPDGLDPRQRLSPGPAGFLEGLDDGVAGLRVGVLSEGFGIPGASDPGVDAAVRAAIARLREAGADVREVSVPSHRDAVHLWSVIGTDGVFGQMLEGNGFGMNVPGRYDPELIEHFARGRREHAAEMSVPLKLTTLLGRYNLDRHGNRYYAMARNLALDLAEAYDAAFADADVLVLPTLPVTAFDMPSGTTSLEEVMAVTSRLMLNTCPFDVTGHPATSVPAGLVDGLPAGLMIAGPRSGDAACLRVARAYEAAVGGFPAPNS
ncbi:MAG: amidase [Streptosporangiales bacterium]|nr:amidase [Streptosporangiales bacterium]